VLHLRGATRQSEELDSDEGGSESRSSRRIQWAEDVIDNEGLGRKKSKGLRLPPLKLRSTTQGPSANKLCLDSLLYIPCAEGNR
jgi:hypothetical protein